MGSTFLTLTNRLLRKINEVELTETNFNTARGLQALAKDAILDSISEINRVKWEWPFNAVETTQALTIGQNEYDWPANFKTVDWESFKIQKDGTYSTYNKSLKPINKDQWYKQLRDKDQDNSTLGISIPDFVFRSHGDKYGVTPCPDKEYILEYRYHKNQTTLENFDDTTAIPQEFNDVITWGGLYHMNLFRENVEGTSTARTAFYGGIKQMYDLLIRNSSETMEDTVVNFGGVKYSETYKL